ncbi:endoplasmic reticulum resident protein 44-like isoform X2 [Mytilus californianus]|uniref:endoplasmic reticulum resident protein 44-like isoform X2 n=1 Tax=Mytilus californianus TaxID=6549 RepID=UPI002245CC7C|nr:endoplasmic reticulum resident protein 44-like isoform X2 [Mytilus californianus]
MRNQIRKMNYLQYFLTVLLLSCIPPVYLDVISMDSQNLKSVLGGHELVFVNFYADWCRFSQILKPVFEEASNKVKEDIKEEGKVAFAKIDCDSENSIAAQYHISKYPTLKLFRNGEPLKKEYRGQRSVDALATFIKDQIKDVVEMHNTLESLDEVDTNKRNVIGYFASQDSDQYRTFAKVANQLREACKFHVAIGPVAEPERTGGDTVVYRKPNTRREDLTYTGSLVSYEHLVQWANDKCVPLVREITFENAEELTEEGLPFLILFYNPDDKSIIERYNTEVAKQLLHEKSAINFLTADGSKFSHPLHHLGKSAKDLPVLAIDSFRHMYVFPHNVNNDLEKPGLLSQFIADLHSGKLHREYHYGAEKTESYPTPTIPGEAKEATGHLPHDKSEPEQKVKQPTSPPESSFIKLAPSRNRYTILRDEL